jgi:hypothetical protein
MLPRCGLIKFMEPLPQTPRPKQYTWHQPKVPPRPPLPPSLLPPSSHRDEETASAILAPSLACTPTSRVPPDPHPHPPTHPPTHTHTHPHTHPPTPTPTPTHPHTQPPTHTLRQASSKAMCRMEVNRILLPGISVQWTWNGGEEGGGGDDNVYVGMTWGMLLQRQQLEGRQSGWARPATHEPLHLALTHWHGDSTHPPPSPAPPLWAPPTDWPGTPAPRQSTSAAAAGW